VALIADNCRDRAEQLILLTERLTALVDEEAQRIDQRLPPLEGAAGEEKNRLSNAYRLELARIKQEPSLIDAAPPEMLTTLRQRTLKLNASLATHEEALNAVKVISEGLVHAMAEEVARQRGAGGGYGASGALEAPSGPIPTIIDRSA
jgi:hypothetical protein